MQLAHNIQRLQATDTNTQLYVQPCPSRRDGLSLPAGSLLRPFQVFVAATRRPGSDKAKKLPWTLPPDLDYLHTLTTATEHHIRRNVVIMGRKAWDSIPVRLRPLDNRFNVVLIRERANFDSNLDPASCSDACPEGVEVCSSLEHACQLLSNRSWQDKVEHVFLVVNGYDRVLREALAHPACIAVHMTQTDAGSSPGQHLQTLDAALWRQWSATPPKKFKDTTYSFHCYVRHNAGSFTQAPAAMASKHEELQYLDLVRSILAEGVARGDRTGVGTLSKFGCSLRFDLRHTFPLLTTKRVFWRGVEEELLWFISGSTNANVLKDKKVNFWNANASKPNLASLGLGSREEGDLGPVYGFQWRHFGAEYTDMHADYRGQGVDQLAEVVRQLRENPMDRRIILSAWNPAAQHLMALPPCHMMCQFYVANGELSCQMVMRGADMGLGLPFNIASYALLTRLMAHVSNLAPGELIIVMGDAHVYTNHMAPLQEQLQNEPLPFPVLKINPDKRDIDQFTLEDLLLEGYQSHKTIPMQMAL